MFNSSLGVGGEFKNSIFFSKIQLLYLLTCFSYLFLVVWFLFACVFLSFFFCLFCVSYELSWCLVIVIRMHWFLCLNCFLSQIWDTFAFL